MRKITLSEYNAIPENYRGIWTIERWDLPDWAEIRKRHIGKRTMMVYPKSVIRKSFLSFSNDRH